MSQLTFNANLTIAGGPQLGVAQSIALGDYELIDATIPMGGAATTVSLHTNATDQILMFAIVSDWYGATLTYKIDAAAGQTLDAPLVLAGSTATAQYAAVPATAVFSNATPALTGTDAHIKILIGRKS